MLSFIRRTLRWSISTVLVTLPVSYIFWQWRYEDHKILGELSYEAFNERFVDAPPGAFWTYFLYVLAAILCINLAIAVLAAGIERVFPDESVRLPKDD